MTEVYKSQAKVLQKEDMNKQEYFRHQTNYSVSNNYNNNTLGSKYLLKGV
mgnify:CR=1 FL=1